MNLENVDDRIELSIDNFLNVDSLRNSTVIPTWRSVYSFVWDLVWDSVYEGLQNIIREERERR
jgi:hypothetical protein